MRASIAPPAVPSTIAGRLNPFRWYGNGQAGLGVVILPWVNFTLQEPRALPACRLLRASLFDKPRPAPRIAQHVRPRARAAQ